MLIGSCLSCSNYNTKAKSSIKTRFNIDSVEASFPVKFSQTIANNNHFIAYFDHHKTFCIAYRQLKDSVFKKTALNSKIEWDSHNYTALAVDNQGYIHVSGNMHNAPLNYWRSKYPYDASEFEAIHRMTGFEENQTTYPEFLKTNSGNLLFHYRHGGSGNGYEVYNLWNPDHKTWTRFLDQPLIDGEGQKNAYMSGPHYEKDGYYHLYWVWRDTPDCASNHSFSYAKSKDLKHWETAQGTPVNSPLVFGEKRLVVDAPQNHYGNGMLNGVQKHCLDSKNNILLCNMKYDASGNSQLYVYRLNSNHQWDEKCITTWNHRFDFSGGGSIIFDIKLKGMRLLDGTNIGVIYEHSIFGNGEIVLDEDSLSPISIREFKPNYPEQLTTVLTKGSYSKPVEVHINQYGKYIIRWETLAENNDLKPEGDLPKPYMMECIELQ